MISLCPKKFALTLQSHKLDRRKKMRRNEEIMNTAQFVEFLPIILPLIVAELALALVALVHVLRHPNYKFGNKAVWIVIVLLIQIIGPVIYFTLGRGEE